MVGIPLSHLLTMHALETQVSCFETLLLLVGNLSTPRFSSFCGRLLGAWSLLLLHVARHERAVRAMKSKILISIFMSINLRKTF